MHELSSIRAVQSNGLTTESHARITNLGKTFWSKRGNVEALRSINLDVPFGEFVSIVGPSGCGKSTLLRCVAGLDSPSSGEVTISGRKIREPPEGIGLVFQRDVLFEWHTVLGNVLLPAEFVGRDRAGFVERAHELLTRFGLDGFQERYPWELSGGMRQRVSICRALLLDPPLLLMDEPFGALDAFTRDQLNLLLHQIRQTTRKTVIFITHSISEAVFLADRVAVMKRRPGEIVEVIDIELPTQRPLSLRETKQFTEYTGHIRSLFEQLGTYRD
jgi:NitT/TauT family transport system ATP-binding protein